VHNELNQNGAVIRAAILRIFLMTNFPNTHNTHSVAVFSRMENSTGEPYWIIRFTVRGKKGTPEDTTLIRWKLGQSWWTDTAECDLFCATIKAQRQVAITVPRIVECLHFLERVEGATITKGGAIEVHTDPAHYEQESAAAN
jgi:hypothetical protein